MNKLVCALNGGFIYGVFIVTSGQMTPNKDKEPCNAHVFVRVRICVLL
jgi:hypothetical protein